MRMNGGTILFSLILGTLGVFFASGVSAQSVLFRSIDRDTIERGYTFSYERGAFRLALPPRALSGPTDVRIELEHTRDRDSALAAPPEGMIFATDAYSYTFSGDATLTRPITVVVTSPAGDALSALYQYNGEKKKWDRLSTSRNNYAFFSSARSLEGTFAVLRYKSEDAQLASLLGSSRALMVADTQYHTYVAQNTQEQLPLASLTKLMTALVFLDTPRAWNKKIAITTKDDAQPAKINFALGDVVTVKDLFWSMLIGSKNNSAKALARSTGLSEKEFIRRMNQKARNFGMTQTVFDDVTGLSPKNRSTARDYYRLARVALQQSDIKRAVQTRAYKVRVLNRKKSFSVYTTDEMLDGTKRVYGKTGYTAEAGYNLVLLAEQKNKPIIILVLGAPSSDQRFDLAGAILRHSW